MTLTSKRSIPIFAGLALAIGGSAARADEAPPTSVASSAPVATVVRPVHFGLVPFGGERELDVHGVSFSLIVDRVGRFSGLQLSPGINQTLAGSRGVQLSGVVNLADGDLRGVQATGAVNLVEGSMRGVQLAGGANVAASAVGLQMSPVNVAGDSTGVQLGVVNVARREAKGLQLGVANVAARSRGFTLGVVNVAREHDGEAFGLFNFIGNGIHDVAVYATDTMLTNAAVKLGGRHLYTAWSLGYNPGDKLPSGAGPAIINSDNRRVGVGFGVGYRFALALGYLQFMEVEATGMSVQSKLDFSGENVPLLTAARVIFGIEVTRELTVIAGVSENVAVATNGRDLDLQRGGLESVFRSGDTTVRMYPGLLLGLQL